MEANQDFIPRTIPRDCHRVLSRIQCRVVPDYRLLGSGWLLGVPEWWNAQLVWVVSYFPFNLVQIESKIRHAIISG